MDIKVRDSNGALLAEGDTVTLIKDLKLKGSSTVLKRVSKTSTSPTIKTRSKAAPTRSKAWCCAPSF